MNIIVKRYEHFNRALNKHITSKAHYKKEMQKQGMVSYEEGQVLADKWKRDNHKDYRLSKDGRALVSGIAMKRPDKNGKIKLSDREIDKMKSMGVRFERGLEKINPRGGF